MKTSTSALVFALPVAFMLACGGAHAQLKAPAKSQPKAPLGSGLSAPAAAAEPAAEVKAPTADEVVQEIANCVLAGLPADWTLAQIDVIELARDGKQREFEAKYLFTGADGVGKPFAPCDLREPAMNVYKLNGALPPEKRNWIKATLVFSKEGKFELQYDYAKEDEAKPAETPAEKPAAAAPKKAAREKK